MDRECGCGRFGSLSARIDDGDSEQRVCARCWAEFVAESDAADETERWRARALAAESVLHELEQRAVAMAIALLDARSDVQELSAEAAAMELRAERAEQTVAKEAAGGLFVFRGRIEGRGEDGCFVVDGEDLAVGWKMSGVAWAPDEDTQGRMIDAMNTGAVYLGPVLSRPPAVPVVIRGVGDIEL